MWNSNALYGMVDVHTHMKIMQCMGRRLSGSVYRLTLLYVYAVLKLSMHVWISIRNWNADRTNTNMAEFQRRVGCPCTILSPLSWNPYARACEFDYS